MAELNITPDTSEDKQAHIDAMVAKAEGRTPEQPAAGEPAPVEEQAQPERPAWLPEKFATPEDMAKAYAALEGKLGGKQEAAPEDTTQADADKAASDAAQAAGLDVDALGAKIVKNGDLDASDYEALAKQGISKEMVQAYVAGQQAIASQMVARMHETVGGEENFNNLLEWAGKTLSADEIAAFNNTIDNGSEAAVKLALQGLNAQYKASDTAPKLVGGKRVGTESGEVFRSTAELTKAMSDPRYSRDPAYRADVAAKLARSKIL